MVPYLDDGYWKINNNENVQSLVRLSINFKSQC